MEDDATREAVEAALAKLDLDAKARLLQGQDMWTLPALPEIGLGSLVMSDGPVGVRGVFWGPDDPSILLPSPTAMAATWDPELIARAGVLLAQEARRKGVHLLLAPTVNMHRTPVGGRHFEAYSEDPFLTGAIGSGYVRGVQSGGVGTTVKHFVANDAETDRMSVDNIVSQRALRELYLAPFETIVKSARPWAIMSAYNSVNGTTMSEHSELLNGVLRGEWGFDGCVVSDWMGTHSTVGAILGGLDIAMPGPRSVYGELLAEAVRGGEVDESVVDDAVRRVLLLAARAGLLEGARPAVTDFPETVDGRALTHEIASRSFVLVRNATRGDAPVLPIDPADTTVALIGLAARDARVLGGGSAMVFPEAVVSPLDGLTAALPDGSLSYSIGAMVSDQMGTAERGFELRARCYDAEGTLLRELDLPGGAITWMGTLPEGIEYATLHTIEVLGTFTPQESGSHSFGTKGLGQFTLTVGGETLFDGDQALESFDPFELFFGAPKDRGAVELVAGEPVEVALRHTPVKMEGSPIDIVSFSLGHRDPQRDPEELMAEAVEAARQADVAVVVVATTEQVESEGFDRTTLNLPGRQDELVTRVAAANPRTVVVVNAGSPVEMPWRDEVAAVLLSWFPGQEAGAALADVLVGSTEPGGRLPTTWPATLADCPVTDVTPVDGKLAYTEDLFIGYRAWDRSDVAPAYPFGHGLGYTTWEYEGVEWDGETVTVRVRNTGSRRGREVVQAYLAAKGDPGDRPARALAGFASVEANPGETATAAITLPRRAFELWDEESRCWSYRPGAYDLLLGPSSADCPLGVAVVSAENRADI
ncbi:beta-glucosidase [Rhodococcus maanshanensis]|uniref:Beta-glucosidase n=1 Tax=Rhodococcus maanshanensis TaxID=183556 RepID=A0A1H7R0B9_9NOCA|nr:glycoside hydrolase family 3 C-terminal domain-containing protein [Rhodococcus maanshanensis]SEL53711.1 beta-glucosidase [Rhodococcus maanshanensis]